MLIYHQCGHNFIWNIDSLKADRTGSGLIISPLNIEAEKIKSRISPDLLKTSWLDPQFYLPDDKKGSLRTYSYFPANVLETFSTVDYHEHAYNVAKECLQFQHNLGLRYLVIPIRYFDDIPDNYLEQFNALFLDPFVKARHDLGLTQPLLLTIIAKPIHLQPGMRRDDLLSWATSSADISGIYLIFDNNFHSKQIKDAEFLAGALRFIRILRFNDLEVHIGYSGIEGLLYSVADATSVSVGSYENLRSFNIKRLKTQEPGKQRSPSPRVYSGKLLQWIESVYLPPLRNLTPNWEGLFDDSPYKDYLLDPSTSLNSQRPELYKHYFQIFFDQVNALPIVDQRVDHIKQIALESLALFEQIKDSGVFLDSDSDGSHLPGWINALEMYRRKPE